MLEFYPQVKAVHVGAVVASGALFAMRGALAIAGRRRVALRAPLRYASVVIDTVLLAAGATLVAMLPSALFANHWLAVKLVLLVVYIALGIVALRAADRHPRRAAACYAFALVAFLAMIGIALAHHPLGWLVRAA